MWLAFSLGRETLAPWFCTPIDGDLFLHLDLTKCSQSLLCCLFAIAPIHVKTTHFCALV